MLIDCHTHDTTRTDAIISVSPALFRPEEGKHYSVGIHPWETGATLDFELLERASHKLKLMVPMTSRPST